MKKMNSKQAINLFKNKTNQYIQRIVKFADYKGIEMENESKQKAPWKDITGNARNSIFSSVTKEAKTVTIHHGIKIEYGKYLELSNEGKYRIIKPTVDQFKEKIIRDIKDVKI